MLSGNIPIKVTVFGIAPLKGYIDRIFAPLTADSVLDKMPFALRGRFSFRSKTYWTLPGIGFREGLNPKSIKKCEKGEIIYDPKLDELIILIEAHEMPNKVNKVGKITSNLELLKNASNGLNTKFSK